LKQRYQLDYKAKPILICSLSEEGIAKVYALSSAKEIWETLALTHGGSKKSKEIN